MHFWEQFQLQIEVMQSPPAAEIGKQADSTNQVKRIFWKIYDNASEVLLRQGRKVVQFGAEIDKEADFKKIKF